MFLTIQCAKVAKLIKTQQVVASNTIAELEKIKVQRKIEVLDPYTEEKVARQREAEVLAQVLVHTKKKIEK